jgi:hypothetical protein
MAPSVQATSKRFRRASVGLADQTGIGELIEIGADQVDQPWIATFDRRVPHFAERIRAERQFS